MMVNTAYAVFGFTPDEQTRIAKLVEHGNINKLSEAQMIQTLIALAGEYQAKNQTQDLRATQTLINILFNE